MWFLLLDAVFEKRGLPTAIGHLKRYQVRSSGSDVHCIPVPVGIGLFAFAQNTGSFCGRKLLIIPSYNDHHFIIWKEDYFRFIGKVIDVQWGIEFIIQAIIGFDKKYFRTPINYTIGTAFVPRYSQSQFRSDFNSGEYSSACSLEKVPDESKKATWFCMRRSSPFL